jgi:hypothetical protein
MGATQSVAYSAGNFSQDTGTWTVQSGDQTSYSYRLVGDTMWLNVTLQTTTVASSPTNLIIAVPGGKTIQETTYHYSYGYDNGAPVLFKILATSGQAFISVTRFDGAAFAAATNSTDVVFQIEFKVN